MIKKLFAIIKKNFKLLIRSKNSSLVIIFGPLLLILLVGIAFNAANVYSVRMGTYSESYSTLTESIVDSLAKQDITVTKIDSKDNCIESIKRGVNHVCAIFPANLQVKEGGDIVFYVDNSKINLVYVILDKISKEIGTKTKELSLQLTKTVIDTLDFTEREINDKKKILNDMINAQVQSSSKITEISNDLSIVDLSFDIEKFRLDSLTSKIENLGLENSTRDEIIAVVGSIRTTATETGNKIKIASQSIQKTKENLELVKANLIQSREYGQAIDSIFTNIAGDISDVKLTNIGRIVSPINSRVEPITSEKTFINYLFPTLVILIIMFVCILLASITEIREKTSKVFFKNFITPTSDLVFIIGNFLSNFVVIMLQLVILFGVAYFFFKDQLVNIIPDIAVVIPIIAAFFIFLGMILGNIFRSEETAMIAAISLSFIMLFFSNAIIPIESMPETISKISYYNPFLMAESMINKILLLQNDFRVFLKEIYLLLGYTGGALILVMLTKKMAKV